MSKKTKTRRPPRFTRKPTRAVPLPGNFDRIDLKSISAAFDAVLEHLDAIAPRAKDRADVKATMKRLERLQSNVAGMCPQYWFVPFELKSK
jgi:hypothetical protein